VALSAQSTAEEIEFTTYQKSAFLAVRNIQFPYIVRLPFTSLTENYADAVEVCDYLDLP
jgi:hypothetical protein